MKKKKKEYFYRCVKNTELKDSRGATIYCVAGDLKRDAGGRLVGETILRTTKRPLLDTLVGTEPLRHVEDKKWWPHFIQLAELTEKQKSACQHMVLREDFYGEAEIEIERRPEYIYKCLKANRTLKDSMNKAMAFPVGYIIRTQWPLLDTLVNFELIEDPDEEIEQQSDLVFPQDKFYQGE